MLKYRFHELNDIPAGFLPGEFCHGSLKCLCMKNKVKQMGPCIKKVDGCLQNSDKLIFAGNLCFNSGFNEVHEFRGGFFKQRDIEFFFVFKIAVNGAFSHPSADCNIFHEDFMESFGGKHNLCRGQDFRMRGSRLSGHFKNLENR